MVTSFANALDDIPRAQQIRAAMLKEALTFYKGLQQEGAADPAVRRETAMAFARVGEIHLQLGEGSQAEAALREAITLLELLITDFPREQAYREGLHRCYAMLADVYRETGKEEEFREAIRVRLALLEALAADYPAVRAHRDEIASNLVTLAIILQAEDARRDEAEAVLRRAAAVAEKARVDFPGTPEDPVQVAYFHWGYGTLLARTDRLADAEKHFRQALHQYEADLAKAPNSGTAKHWVVTGKTHLPRVLNKTGRAAEAERLLREATAMQEKRGEEFPHFREYRRQMGRYQEAWGLTLFGLSRIPEAEQALRNGLATRVRVARDFQNPLPGEAADLGWSHFHLGELLLATTRPAEAGEQFRQALGLFEQNAAGFPDVARYHYHLAWLLAACPDPQLRDPARALRHAQEALRLAPGRAVHWTCLGIARYRSGQWQEAADALEKSRQLNPAGDGFAWFFLALAHGQVGQTAKARQEYDAGIQWLSQNRHAELEVHACRRAAAALLGVGDEAR